MCICKIGCLYTWLCLCTCKYNQQVKCGDKNHTHTHTQKPGGQHKKQKYLFFTSWRLCANAHFTASLAYTIFHIHAHTILPSILLVFSAFSLPFPTKFLSFFQVFFFFREKESRSEHLFFLLLYMFKCKYVSVCVHVCIYIYIYFFVQVCSLRVCP